MTISEKSLEKPPLKSECSPEEILTGPQITPKQHIKLYDSDKFEEFIEEWAYYYLQSIKGVYTRVACYGGSGDKGRDIVGYIDETVTPKLTDIYQCKHYDHPIAPNDIYIELAKLCYYTYEETIPAPLNYYIVAPQDLGPSLGLLLEDISELKTKFISKWKDGLTFKISNQKILLEGDLESYVNDFNFNIVQHKPIQEIIAEFRQTTRYAPRFGGGLTKPLPEPISPPGTLGKNEIRYIEQLVMVYREKLGNASLQVKDFLTPVIEDYITRHFLRSRERFYYAETLREFSRDNLPEEYPFSAIQDDVYDGVSDIFDQPSDDTFKLINLVTEKASTVNVGNHPLKKYIKSQAFKGICHQLVNDSRLSWIEK